MICGLFSSKGFANQGHRLGGDLYEGDNTLQTFGKLLDEHRNSSAFEYAEYDIRESADGQLVAYHDPLLGEKKIEELSLNEIRALKPDIATVNEIYEFSIKNKLPKNKPLAGDIKHLKTDKARSELIRLANKHKDKIETWFMGKPDDIKAAFDDLHRWAVMFRRNDIPMFIPKRPKNILNDQFAYMHTSELNFKYATLTERRVSFSNEENRVQLFDVDVTAGEDSPKCLRLGVMNGYDDMGDRKSRMRVLNRDTNHVLHDVYPSAKGWQWLVLSDIPKNGVTIEWSDLDTPMNGRHPGNAILVNVTLGTWDPLTQ